MAEENVDVGEGGEVQGCEVEAWLGCWGRGLVVEVGQLVEEEAEVAFLLGEESVETVCVVLDCVVGGCDAVVECDHGAAVAGGVGDGQLHCLVQVQGAIGGDGGGGTHSTNDNDGLGRGDCEVEEEGGFLEGISTVCDNSTIGGVLGQIRGDSPVELEEDGAVDVARVNVGDLVTKHVGDVEKLWNCINQSGDCNSSCGVSRCLGS